VSGFVESKVLLVLSYAGVRGGRGKITQEKLTKEHRNILIKAKRLAHRHQRG